MITIRQVRAAVALSDFDGVTAQLRMAPAGRAQMHPDPAHPPRIAAVLVLIAPMVEAGLHVVLTLRSSRLRGHSGQVSFPGGRKDPEDATLRETALRETCEELAICNEKIDILGTLDDFWIPPSNYMVTPFVGVLPYFPRMTPNPIEVERAFTLSLATLVDDGIKRSKPMTFGKYTVDVPYYQVEGYTVWGATAMMLSDLEWRLRTVLDQSP